MIIDVHTHPFGSSRVPLKDIVKRRRDVVILRRTHPEIFKQMWTELDDETDLLVEDMDRNGIDKAVIQPSVGERSDYISGALKRHPTRLVGLCHLGQDSLLEARTTIDWGRVDDYFAEQRENGVSGVGEVVVSSITDADTPRSIAMDMRPLMDLLVKHGLSVQFPTGWTQFDTPFPNGIPLYVDYLAIEYPDVRITLTKMGRGYQSIFDVALAIAFRHRYIYLETADSDPLHIRRAVSELGADRVMFGSDWTGTWRAIHGDGNGLYPHELGRITSAGLDEEETKMVLGGTAAELYGLE